MSIPITTCVLASVSSSQLIRHFSSLRSKRLVHLDVTKIPLGKPLHLFSKFHRFCPYLLDVVVAQSTSILQLLACEDQALLIRWDSFLVLNLRLHIVDRVARLDLEGDGLARQGLDEDLHCRLKEAMVSRFSGSVLFS